MGKVGNHWLWIKIPPSGLVLEQIRVSNSGERKTVTAGSTARGAHHGGEASGDRVHNMLLLFPKAKCLREQWKAQPCGSVWSAAEFIMVGSHAFSPPRDTELWWHYLTRKKEGSLLVVSLQIKLQSLWESPCSLVSLCWNYRKFVYGNFLFVSKSVFNWNT